MCAKATNVVIPPHPSPPQTCRSIDHVSTCKQHHSGVASTMCAKATNVIIPPHQTPPQTCRSKKPGQQKTAFYSYGFQAVGKNMELETFVLKSTCTLPKINIAHRPWGRPTNLYRLMSQCPQKYTESKTRRDETSMLTDPNVLGFFWGIVLLADA